jgi:hypothetical protein
LNRGKIAAEGFPTRPCARASFKVSAAACTFIPSASKIRANRFMASSEQIAARFQQGFNVFIDLNVDLMFDFDIHIDGNRLLWRSDFNARRTAGQ